MKITAFVPIKFKSQRLKNKMNLLLGEKRLFLHILDVLVTIPKINQSFVYSSKSDIINDLPNGIKYLERPSSLDDENIKGKEIYDTFIKNIDSDYYLLCHATSPFITKKSIESAIFNVCYNKTYDSALCVKKIQNFIWYDNKPLNYSLKDIPRTQDLKPVYEETSAFFLFSKTTWLQNKSRIGMKPFFVELNSMESVDIDNQDDFNLAKYYLNNK